MPPHGGAAVIADGRRARNLRLRYDRLLFGELRGASTAVISAESLSDCQSAGVKHLRRDLETAGFRNFRIVLYIRDPADYYLSYTQQMLKKLRDIPDPTLFRYPFANIAATWEAEFPGSVVVRNFRSDPEFDVVQDFSNLMREHLGVSLPALPPRLNTTISAEGMEILDQLRQLNGEGKRSTRRAGVGPLAWYLRSAGEVPQTKPALRSTIADRIRANHRADAEQVLSLYGVDLGLRDSVSVLPRDDLDRYRVADILQCFDPEAVTQLLLFFVKNGLDREPRRRNPVSRVAARIYRVVRRPSLPTPRPAWWKENSPIWK